MASDDAGTDALVSWYANNVARPTTADEAYGYWAYVVGAALAVLGLVAYLFTTTVDGGSAFWTLRTLSFSLVAIGLPVVLYGFVIVLPLGERATQVAVLGLAASFVAVVAFLLVYPGSWNVRSGADYSGQIIVVYALGLAVQVGATLASPSSTAGERPDSGGSPVADEPDGDATIADAPASEATFELYRDAGEEWRWRLRHRSGQVLADGSQGYASKGKAQQGLESVRRNAPDAPTVEAGDE